MGIFGLDIASQYQKQKDAEAANAEKYRQSTVMPVIPKYLKTMYFKKMNEGPKHFLPADMRAQIFSQMERGGELRARQNDRAITARTGGDTSSIAYQYLQTLNNQGLQAETGSNIAQVDIADLQQGEQKRRADLEAIFKMMGLSTGSRSTAPPKPVPGIDYAGALNGSLNTAASLFGGMSGAGMGPTGA